ncbi:hypothetical protein EBR96_08410, partial [bacterium]|nr:hypothetical protein [bacterium]
MGILNDAVMKFNLRVVAYLLIYVAGTLFLTSRNASAITVIVFGLVTIGTIAAILSQNSAKRPPRRETRKPATSTDRDLRIAQDVQQALLNLPVPDVAGIKVAKYCKAATRIG